MRSYEPLLYRQLVGESEDSVDREKFAAETALIKEMVAPARDMIDLGAGYGRIIPDFAPIARQYIALEINPAMYAELKNVAVNFPNVEVINGDFINLEKIVLDRDLKNPLMFLVQNTLGTIEGNTDEVIESINRIINVYDGELILGLLRQEALEPWGQHMYQRISEMVGGVDPTKSDFNEGLFVSKTGYESKWWKPSEIKELTARLGTLQDERTTDAFKILHIVRN